MKGKNQLFKEDTVSLLTSSNVVDVIESWIIWNRKSIKSFVHRAISKQMEGKAFLLVNLCLIWFAINLLRLVRDNKI